MSRTSLQTVGLVLLVLMTGCCQFTDRLCDGVDHFSDREPCFDHWYNPHCDLTREYRPDGGNHWLFRRCGCACEQCP